MEKFEIGEIEISSAASNVLEDSCIDLKSLLARHQCGDWGDVSKTLQLWNEWGVEHGGLICSEYSLLDEERLFVNTAADRNDTWILLESEYERKEINVQEGYARWARSYDREINPLIEIEKNTVNSILAELSAKNALDAGTGTGRFADKLAQRGVQVCAIDQSPEMLNVAKKWAQQNKALQITFQRGSLHALPFKPNYFDLIVCGLVLCHVPDIFQVMKEFARVTCAGGTLLITDFHPTAVAAGWRTAITQGESGYLLPTTEHSRDDYLEALEKAGFILSELHELRLRDMPTEIIPFFERWVEEQGDKLFSLIILAKKI